MLFYANGYTIHTCDTLIDSPLLSVAIGDFHVTVETLEATPVPATRVVGQSCKTGGSTSIWVNGKKVPHFDIFINKTVNN